MKNKKGITFAEVIIALALLTLSVGGIVGVLVQNSSTGQSIDYTYVATNLAKNRIERLREVRRDRGYADLLNWQETDTSIDRYGNSDENGNFERTTIITTGVTANLTQVTVRVNYKRGGTLVPVATELVTLLSPYYD